MAAVPAPRKEAPREELKAALPKRCTAALCPVPTVRLRTETDLGVLWVSYCKYAAAHRVYQERCRAGRTMLAAAVPHSRAPRVGSQR
jgi:RNase P subunit RPR2